MIKITMTQEQIHAGLEKVHQDLLVFQGQSLPAAIGVCVTLVDFSLRQAMGMSRDMEQGKDASHSRDLGQTGFE